MANTMKAVKWSMAEGANAVEIDIRFNGDGSVKEFRHGGICDCTCTPHCLPLGGQADICNPLGCKCSSATPAVKMLQYLATYSKLALIMLDSKVDGKMTERHLIASGVGMVRAINIELFDRGYKGKVVISAGKPDAMSYIQSAVREAAKSKYASRIYFAFDQTGGSATDGVCALHVINRLNTRNIVYGTGLTSCVPATFYDAIKVAVSNRERGAIGMSYIWTIDKESSMRTYLKLRTSAIITNRPGLLRRVALSMGYKLATPSTPIKPATAAITGGNPSRCPCDCDYHPGGCRVSFPAPKGMACQCKYKTLQWTCKGEVVNCRNSNSPHCKIPDTTKASCQNGRGDCDAYK
jgi:hypothetical protein